MWQNVNGPRGLPMAEIERERERDRRSYERQVEYLIGLRNRAFTGQVLLRGEDQPWEISRQGRLKFFICREADTGSALNDWVILVHDVRVHSGKHRHQGGLVIYVLDGEGYTEVDNEKVEWQAGDLLLLPIKPGGVEHKHYNKHPGQNCKWMAFIFRPYNDAMGYYLEQMEDSPEYRKKNADENLMRNLIQSSRPAGTPLTGGFGADSPSESAGQRAGGTLFDALLRLRDEQREKRGKGAWLIQGANVPWEINQHGKMQWYMHPAIEDVCIQTVLFYKQEIPPGSRSGRQKCQGNVVFYVEAGRGYTVVDGVSYKWRQGDVINLPIKEEGVVYQHFNGESRTPAMLVACEPNFMDALGVDRGSGFEELEPAPEYLA
jgi:quercetin dioxygenase-like cupin family protein